MTDDETATERVACSVDEVPEGESHVVELDGVDVAVFHVDGEYYALNNVCPHQGGPLGDGKVDDGCVFCPWHGWQFEIESGEHAHGLKTATSYEVTIDGEDVVVTF